MRFTISARYAFAVCASISMLAGCGGSQPPVGAPAATAQTRTIAGRNGRDASWMRPGAKSENLLYASAYENNDVTVVTYPGGTVVGTLTGFSSPYGLCVDTAGDVWITSSSQIIEYAHGGANPIATLSDSGYTTTDCSVDPTTGNLAVSEVPAGIAVYAHASGSPEQYFAQNKNISRFVDCSYDNKGDLFALGIDSASRKFKLKFAELPAGGKKVALIKFPGVGSPSGIQWDGQYVAVGGYTSIVQYAVSGNTAKFVGATPLKGFGRAGGEADFWIQGKTVVVVPFGSDATDVLLFRYPAGGKPLKKIGGLNSAASVTVSLAQP